MKSCPHAPEYSPTNKAFLSPKSKAVTKLNNVLFAEANLSDYKHAINFKHTGYLENLNSSLCKYAPNRIFFPEKSNEGKSLHGNHES